MLKNADNKRTYLGARCKDSSIESNTSFVPEMMCNVPMGQIYLHTHLHVQFRNSLYFSNDGRRCSRAIACIVASSTALMSTSRILIIWCSSNLVVMWEEQLEFTGIENRDRMFCKIKNHKLNQALMVFQI